MTIFYNIKFGTMNKVTLTILMCLTISALNAQTTDMRSCEQIIANSGDGLSEGEMDQHVVAAIARCHVQMLDNLLAARWYEKIADLESCDPVYLMEYGQCLKSLKLYGKAKFYFQKYAQYHPVAGNQFMQSCDIAKLMLAGEPLYTVTPVKWNSPASEYAPSVKAGKLIYNSWQSTSPATTVNTWNTAESNMQPILNEFKDMGAISHVRFSGNGKSVVYANSGFVANERLISHAPGTQIYIADVNANDRWSAAMPISLCSESHAVGYPSLSNDGTTLYFASNMDGGHGGWDIYVSKRTGDVWSKPENLGGTINTPGNEISPYFADDRIYFSSDWHAGIGGFDVFVASVEDGKFSPASSVGYPVNSPKDDIDFVWDASSGSAYFSSNRIGGMGLYDLYKAVPQFREIEVSVMHKDNMKPVDNVVLTMSPGNAIMYYTNTTGYATMYQPLTGEREVVIKKDGYKEQKLKLSSGEGATQAYQVYLEPMSKPTSTPGEVRVVQDAKPVNKTPESVKPPVVSKPAAHTPAATPVSTKEMYFIQIAALARNASLDPYSVLRSYGNLILHDDGMYAKVRVGTFSTEAEAKLVLSRIKEEGFKDAFVVKQPVTADVTSKTQTSVSTSEYKVRLGTYSKLANFNPDLVNNLGSIESYRKNELTIMLLAGYANLTAAEKARDAAASRGFTDAYVVMDNGGIFERVRN